MRVSATMPKRIVDAMSIQAKTGFLMDTSVMLTAAAPHRLLRMPILQARLLLVGLPLHHEDLLHPDHRFLHPEVLVAFLIQRDPRLHLLRLYLPMELQAHPRRVM